MICIFLVNVFVAFVNAGRRGTYIQHGLRKEGEEYGDPALDIDVIMAKRHESTISGKFAPICETFRRGDMCYRRRQTPYEHYKCPYDYCFYKPKKAYYCDQEVEIYQSNNEYYPPRLIIRKCKYVDFPCYKVTITSTYTYQSYGYWCPTTRCTQEFYAMKEQELWVRYQGRWMKRYVIVKYPWGCTCGHYSCNANACGGGRYYNK